MTFRHTVRGGIATIVVAGVMSVVPLWGYSGDAGSEFGTNATPSACTNCHSGGTVNPTTQFSGVASYLEAGDFDDFTFNVSSASYPRRGFWMWTNFGTLSALETGINVFNGGTEAAHSTAHSNSAFSMRITAPLLASDTVNGTITLDGWGNAVDFTGSPSGDYPEKAASTAVISICFDNDGDQNYSTASGANCPFARDCNDNNANRDPTLAETCDGVDNDCNNIVDDGLPNATCGVGACARTGSSCLVSSCTPGSPTTEICDNIDNNCNGQTDEGCDNDGDNYCDASMVRSGTPTVCTLGGNDCNDTNANVNPGVTELCDGIDNDCNGPNGGVDEGCDDDGDGYCDANMTRVGTPAVCTLGGNDCNDGNFSINPGRSEICNNINDDCDNASGSYCSGNSAACTDEGCDDDNDNRCDSGMTKQVGVTVSTCTATPSGASSGDDCNDAVNTIYPGAPETCNNISDDCDASIDEGCDDDGDNRCDANMAKQAGLLVATCTSTPAGASSGNDCNDNEATVYPGASELCDGLDNDCNNQVDDNISSLTCGLGICQAMASGCVGGVPQSCTPGTPGTESCSNQGTDNDCDGVSDELINNVFLNDPCTVPGAQGICAPGSRSCSGSTLTCVSNQSPGTESCANTGIDNDCDGNANELTNGVFAGDACTVSGAQGICAPGTRTCSGNSLVCVSNQSPGTETCSNIGIDNDCDGNSNEIADGVVSGDACDTGKPGVCGPGTRSCSGNSLVCIGTISPGSNKEVCDGLDNDCDGTADNNIAQLSCGQGACRNTVPACSGGKDNKCTPLPSSDEICDGIDNDCNGQTDEGCDDDNDDYCDVGMTVSGTPPTCSFGGGDCNDQAASTYPGAPELCDAIDNDCNNSVDDNVVVVSCGVGECTREATGCTNGKPENCTPGPEEPEVCDGLDNDCDGVVDNGLAPAKCGLGECATEGSSCLADSCTPLPSSLEICDGLDNDCNGKADEVEDVPLAVCGVGACARTGSSCDPASCTAGTPLAEICDGLDNDCNGVVDDGLPSATCGVGQCAAVGVSCQPSSCQPGVPEAEICDGLDNDCDGEVDNGCDDDNDGYCDANLVFIGSPICENGEGDCDDLFADSHPGAPELCDDKDNDCNGEVNDNITEEHILCGVGACISAGTACVDEVAEGCSPLEPGELELCNGIDDDCNGIIDDNLEEVVCGKGECTVVVSGCTDGAEAECVPLEPTTEICDGLDNDCDGEADEEGNSPLCEEGLCIAGECVLLESSQGGASGVVDYSGIDDDDPSLWLDEPEGPGMSLPPAPTEKEDDSESDDDEDPSSPAPDQKGGCSHGDGPHSPSNHPLWYIILAGLTVMARRRRIGT